MKLNTLYTSVCLAICLLFSVTACRQEKENLFHSSEKTGSMTLQFNLSPINASRSENVTNLNYWVKDGKIIPCGTSETLSTSRAGDGNVADGGGMADLKVYLVDNNNQIIDVKTISANNSFTTETINYYGLASGTYTAYALANIGGNEGWISSLPGNVNETFPNETSYYLASSNGTPPTVINRMPLTGKLTFTIEEGKGLVGTVEMLRTVGKLTVNIKNQSTTKAVIANGIKLDDVLANIGYVFKQNEILPKSQDLNPYSTIENENMHITPPQTDDNIYEGLLYEASCGGLSITLKSYTQSFQAAEQFSGGANAIPNGGKFLIKIAGQDLYLKIVNNALKVVSSRELDNACVWQFETQANDKRKISNVGVPGLSLSMNNNGLTLETKNGMVGLIQGTKPTDIRIVYDKNNKQQATYQSNGTFINSTYGTDFEFYHYIDNPTSSDPIATTIYTDNVNQKFQIHRNEHVQINLIFQ